MGAGIIEMQDMMRVWLREMKKKEMKKFQWRCQPRTRRKGVIMKEEGKFHQEGLELAGAGWLVRMKRQTGPDPYAPYKSISVLPDRRAICIAAISKRQPAKQHVCFEKLLPVMQ